MEVQVIAVDCFGMYGDKQSYVHVLLHTGVICRLG